MLAPPAGEEQAPAALVVAEVALEVVKPVEQVAPVAAPFERVEAPPAPRRLLRTPGALGHYAMFTTGACAGLLPDVDLGNPYAAGPVSWTASPARRR